MAFAIDQRHTTPVKLLLASTRARRDGGLMGLILAFICGVLNFAMHKAVLESRHPLLNQLPWMFHSLGKRAGFAVEFVMLLGSMMMIAAGSTGWAWGYLIYSLVNGLAAWLILSHRI
jgi:hypothetical protein